MTDAPFSSPDDQADPTLLSPPPPEERGPRAAKAILYALAAALLLLLLGVGSLVAGLFVSSALTEPKTLVIAKGSNATEIAEKLEGAGVIRSAFFFRLATKFVAGDSLKAGEYLFPPGQNTIDTALRLHEGDVVIRRLTIAEGLTVHDVLELMKDEPALAGGVTKPPHEGALLPETYRYSYGDSRQDLIDRMQKSQKDLMAELWAKRAPDLALKTPLEALVLASIVEKETGKKAEERARVAGVFLNRLRDGMKLQSDPTVIYALTHGKPPLARELTHEDLQTPSPLNTYANAGLPPDPICNPGKAALEATLHPEKHDFLYFVADGTGGHRFSKTLDEHNQNVTRWVRQLPQTPHPQAPNPTAAPKAKKK